MTTEEIKFQILQALSSLRWAPTFFKKVDRAEIEYVIDPAGLSSRLVRIDDKHPDLKELVQEFSEASREGISAVLTFPEQDPRLFDFLLQEGYEPEENHDICYKKVDEHSFRPHTLKIINIKDKQSLILHQKTTYRAFELPYQAFSEEAIQGMLEDYNSENPGAARFLALDNEFNGEDPEYALGAGGMNLFTELGVATLFGGCTVPEARNRGVYSALTDIRFQYAKRLGISIIGIYANQKTSSPILTKQGFIKCGEMRPWERKQ